MQPKSQKIDVSQFSQGFLVGILLMSSSACVTSTLFNPPPEPPPNRVQQSEGKLYIDTMNRAQRTHYVEVGKFLTEFDAFGLPLPRETSNYFYSVVPLNEMAIQHNSVAKEGENIKNYIGLVWLSEYPSGDRVPIAMICESLTPRNYSAPTFILPELPTEKGIRISCPKGYGLYHITEYL